MNLNTISFLKKNISNLNLENPLIITQNGKPSFVIENFNEYKRKEDIIQNLINEINTK